ncbi:MAG TPA: hypothetical protein VFE46_15920 [Pirellulales bacterium]|jgi:alkylhydroperoxidase family enzyme|nr:hypothetical protein [Pirellulales bacterium]
MTDSLQQAFAEAAKLPAAEQELLATRMLAEMASEDEFDHHIARTSDKLAILAREALAEYRAGLTEELDPDRL